MDVRRVLTASCLLTLACMESRKQAPLPSHDASLLSLRHQASALESLIGMLICDPAPLARTKLSPETCRILRDNHCAEGRPQAKQRSSTRCWVASLWRPASCPPLQKFLFANGQIPMLPSTLYSTRMAFVCIFPALLHMRYPTCPHQIPKLQQDLPGSQPSAEGIFALAHAERRPLAPGLYFTHTGRASYLCCQ